ncbi:MAG TPA: M23 family metallopeptidase [Brevefilum fermentans]|nr:M23 family metallopeptidase [Chloroflexota bacterium]HPX94848.1 M23 family metallopeptidase [Brevefilum fermentans]
MSVQPEEKTNQPPMKRWHKWLSWLVTFILVGILFSVLYWQPILAQEIADHNGGTQALAPDAFEVLLGETSANLPYFEFLLDDPSVMRIPVAYTIAPTRPRSHPVDYEVLSGDAVFSIAQKFNISPETLLWSNYAVLRDDPHTLRIGQVLLIPPTNGIMYEWKEGDTLDAVAAEFKATADDILNWAGNKLDLTNPEIEPGTMVMIPGGQREFQQWVVPTYAVGRSGTASLPEGCVISSPHYYGGGWFIWPADNHYLSGNDFWSGHLAIDIATATGAPIYASDAGVVVFAGWNSNGYGNVVMIDHMNGYHTLYAHLSAINVSCGSNVGQGAVIGYAGSTGNSTGPHLHFEVRYLGGFINPWTVLP